MSLPGPEPVLDLIEAFRRSQTMFAAVGMGVFDRLREGPADAAELAEAIGAHPGATARLLDACAALGLLEKRQSVYANTPLAERYLCAASPDSMAGYIRYSGEALYPMWGHLADAVREGTPRWKQTFQLEGNIFDGFFRTPAAARDFLLGMHGFGMISSPKVAAAFDLSGFQRMADLGGATGHLVMACCQRFPQLHGVVFDLPSVTALAREQIAHAAVRSRIEVAAGDFFTDPLPAADLYALGRILHDWPDEKIVLLLGKIFAQLPVAGGLLIAERLLAEDGVGPVFANMQSLNMLVVAEGRERSFTEYSALLERAGFTAIESRLTGAPLDAIFARKPGLEKR